MLRRRGEHRPGAGAAPARSGCPAVASLYQAGAAAPGEQLLLHRRALQRQRLAGNGANCSRSTTGTAASPWGASRSAKARNALDVCTAFVGRDERAEMDEVIRRFTASVNAPLVIDSTETPVIESALKLHGGKPIINSINFEDGEKRRARPPAARPPLRRRGDRADHRRAGHGEDRPSASWQSRARLVEFACDRHGLQQSDLLIDPLTFTIATGNEDDRKLGQWTLEGIRLIRDALSRHADHPWAVEHQLRPQPGGARGAEQRVPRPRGARRHDRRDRPRLENPAAAPARAGGGGSRRGPDLRSPRATATIRCSACSRCSPTARPPTRRKKTRAATVEGRLKDRIVDGDRKGLADDLDEALTTLQAARHHQHHPAGRHEGGRRAVRRRQDAASVRAAKRGDDEGGGGPPGAAHGARRGPGEGHHRARRPSRATCTTSARTWSTSSSPTTATGWSTSASRCRWPTC